MRNKSEIELIGYVYQDARCPNEEAYPNWAVFKMVVNRKYKDKSGEEKEDTSWYECRTNSEGMAKIFKNHVKDKMGVLVTGIPKAKAYIANDGQPQASIEVVVKELNILTYPRDKESLQDQDNAPKDNGKAKINYYTTTPPDRSPNLTEDEIPF